MFVVFSPDVTPYFIIYRAHAPVLGLPYPPKPHVWCPEKTAVCLRHFLTRLPTAGFQRFGPFMTTCRHPHKRI